MLTLPSKKMQEIRNTILNEWNINLKDIESNLQIEGSNIESLFDLYDKYAFNNSIQQKIDELYEKQGDIINIAFGLSSDQIPSDVERICGVIFFDNKGIKTYEIQISPWLLARIFYSNMANIKEQLLLVFEHQLLHLMTLLWGYINLKNLSDDKLGVHGKLFYCCEEQFFDTQQDIIQNFSLPTSYPQPSFNTGRYTYWSNSCYLDSLSSILYFSLCQYFRDALFTTNVDVIDYSSFVDLIPVGQEKTKVFFSKCDQDSMISDEDKFRNIAKNVQSVMFADYIYMITQKENKKCFDLRALLRECYTDMKDGSWDTYSAAEIYVLFTEMFPSLMIKNYPVKLVDKKGNRRIPEIIKDKPLFTFRDFMDPLKDFETEGIEYEWDKFTSEILVFRNEVTPIRYFNDISSETIQVPVFKKNNKGITIQTTKNVIIEKARIFDEYILNNKYEMVGALLLQGGSSEKQEWGSHYTAVIKLSEGWVSYNDIGNIWKKYDKMPSSLIFTQSGKSKPDMYFYSKIH